jgi:hypothetical protein
VVSSRSEGWKVRGMWVTWFWATRKATSGESPEVGETTVTRASALRRWRMRPAATWICFVSADGDLE